LQLGILLNWKRQKNSPSKNVKCKFDEEQLLKLFGMGAKAETIKASWKGFVFNVHRN
jgi:hypothetical protein